MKSLKDQKGPTALQHPLAQERKDYSGPATPWQKIVSTQKNEHRSKALLSPTPQLLDSSHVRGGEMKLKHARLSIYPKRQISFNWHNELCVCTSSPATQQDGKFLGVVWFNSREHFCTSELLAGHTFHNCCMCLGNMI